MASKLLKKIKGKKQSILSDNSDIVFSDDAELVKYRQILN